MRRTVLAVAVAGSLVAAGCGATVGDLPVLTGRADVNGDATGLSIETDDWTYGGAFGFAWTDAAGVFHPDGGVPTCLGPGASVQVRFAAPRVSVDGQNLRPIVWLDCRGVR